MFFLADDSLIFSKANPKEAKELMGILRKYEKGSGLEVNLEKSLVFFSKNVPQSQQVHVCRKFENIRVVTQGKYLGLPMVISRSKQQIFGFIKEKCEKRMKH